MHLMWQELGEEPLINAEVVVFVMLILSKSFPRYVQGDITKNAAKAFPLSRIYEERGSTPGPIAAFTKRGYRPALRLCFS